VAEVLGARDKDRSEDPAAPTWRWGLGHVGLDDSGEFAEKRHVFEFAEPHCCHAVADTVAGEVRAPSGQIAIEVSVQASGESHEGLTVVVRSHAGNVGRTKLRRREAERVRAFQSAPHPPLSHDGQHSGIYQPGHVSVEAGKGHIR